MTGFLLNIFFPFWPLIGNVSYDSAVVGRHGHASKQVTIEVGPQFATTSPGRGATSCRILKATATSNFEGVARPWVWPRWIVTYKVGLKGITSYRVKLGIIHIVEDTLFVWACHRHNNITFRILWTLVFIIGSDRQLLMYLVYSTI